MVYVCTYRSGSVSGTLNWCDDEWMTLILSSIWLATSMSCDILTMTCDKSHAYTCLAPDLTAIIL